MNNEKILRERYEEIALSLDYNTTASDYNLRELEIDTALEYMTDGYTILDVGCGLGYAVTKYASSYDINAHGIDYAENMIEGAKELLNKNRPEIKDNVTFQQASVLELPYEDNTFDVITSSRCLMALLDWGKQKAALLELQRVLKPGGVMVFMEGTTQGLAKLNDMRNMFGLESIEADGKDRLFTLKFDEENLLKFIKPLFIHEDTMRFGMYYFITRVLHPLLVQPNAPKYDHKINEVAREIAKKIPDYKGIGHLVAFILRKRK